MALKIKQSATFEWPVTVKIAADGGVFDEQTFTAQFARMGVTETDKLVAEIVSGTLPQAEGFARIIKGWRGVEDGGTEVPYSQDALKCLLEIPTFGPAVLAAYQEAVSGVARRKN